MRGLLVSVLILGACGGGGGGGDNGNSPSDSGPPADAPPLTGDMYRLTYGPFPIAPGQEGTKCIWLRLANTAEIKVHQVHNQLSSVSHHLIVYKDDMDTTEQTTPVDCEPFTGALNTTGSIAPLVITQKANDQVNLPAGVAYTLGAGQMIKIEMHYQNSGDAMADALATVDFYAADPGTIQHEANILFIGSPDIDLAPGETETLKQFFTVPSYVDLSASNIFAITGHTHKLGTSMKVRVAPNRMGPMTEVYAPDPFEWSEPDTTTPAQPFSVPTGGGFEFECTWTNTSTQQVEFGESANAEMCFFWAYYYPSQGSKVCIHTNQYGGANGLDVCCPGDNLCSLIEGMF